MKVEKLLKKFRIVFDEQNYYEAHQIARTIYYRWLEQGQYEELAEFLFSAILDFVKGFFSLFIHSIIYDV